MTNFEQTPNNNVGENTEDKTAEQLQTEKDMKEVTNVVKGLIEKYPNLGIISVLTLTTTDNRALNSVYVEGSYDDQQLLDNINLIMAQLIKFRPQLKILMMLKAMETMHRNNGRSKEGIILP